MRVLSWPRALVITVGIALIGIGIPFGRELVSLGYISLVRAKDKSQEVLLTPIFERNYDDVVQANTDQATELERYLDGLAGSAMRSPESLGLDFSSEANYLNSCEKLRALLASSLSYPPPGALPEAQPLSLVRLTEDELATYYELSVLVFDEVHARGVFMMPRFTSGKVPLVIAAHGRGGMPARPKSGKLALVSRSNRDLALGALKKGYAVWEPMFAFYARGRPADLRERLDVRARQCGTSLPAIEIAKIVGGLNALVREQQIDTARIAMVGISYGGFYTVLAAALDPRIRVAVVAAYFNDRKVILDSTEPFGFSDWRFRNSLSVFQDEVMAALVCPRPLQIQSGDHDQLFPIEGARKTVPTARRLYERLRIEERFSFVEFVGRHDFNGQAAWSFIDRMFEADDDQMLP